MTRSDVVGLSLAEIALALLFSFFAIFAPTYSRLRVKYQALSSQTDLKKQLDIAVAENQVLKKQLENFRRHLKSVQTPSCLETKKAFGPLFETVIRSSNGFEIEGVLYDIDGLTSHYAPQLTQAKKNGCILTIKVRFGSKVTTADYNSALNKLERFFYDSRLGSE